MKTYKRIAFIIGMVITLMTLSSTGWAIDDKFSRETLRGLNGVYVAVEDLEPEIERLGLTKNQIQTDVELKLRLAGIKVLTGEEWRREKGRPYLYIQVRVLESSLSGLFHLNINIEFSQNVRLIRDPSIITLGSTWGVDAVGEVGRKKIYQIRNHIKDLLDKFINAWLSVNPK